MCGPVHVPLGGALWILNEGSTGESLRLAASFCTRVDALHRSQREIT